MLVYLNAVATLLTAVLELALLGASFTAITEKRGSTRRTKPLAFWTTFETNLKEMQSFIWLALLPFSLVVFLRPTGEPQTLSSSDPHERGFALATSWLERKNTIIVIIPPRSRNTEGMNGGFTTSGWDKLSVILSLPAVAQVKVTSRQLIVRVNSPNDWKYVDSTIEAIIS